MKVKVLKRDMVILESLGLDKPSFVLGVIEVHQCRRVDKYGFWHNSDKLPDDRLTSVNYAGEDIPLNMPFTIEAVQEFFPGFSEIRWSDEDLKDEFNEPPMKSCWQCKHCWERRPVGKEPLSDWSMCTHPDYEDEHADRGEFMAETCPGYEEDESLKVDING